ncbi:MAG: ecdysteroid 22-kinase family protein [Gammaproteobacteria bacterium]|nr:ecdysteroid 22-kinase family protein [Gammaproteobacteria bacterium]
MQIQREIEQPLIDLIVSVTGASSILSQTTIQSLWSGYGQIVRLHLNSQNTVQNPAKLFDDNQTASSVILKHIRLPERTRHPRGWNTDWSHQRKVRSYQVEAHWYQHYAQNCDRSCIVPSCLAVQSNANETILVLTDLDALGFSERKTQVESQDIHSCLKWLANFHATFLNKETHGLWECGTYWHLDTRPDELAALNDEILRQAAPLIDQKLKQCEFQTLVHGDAKLANFCFKADWSESTNTPKVAAVDFQYVGKGCGMKDVAYFLGSCLYEDECEHMEAELLDSYFSELCEQVALRQQHVNVDHLEAEWRAMYPLAWADFHRFIKGWSPGHWKINSYSERLTAQVIASLDNNNSII